MESTLKYKSSDLWELIEVFSKVNDEEDKVKAITENIDLLSKYPEEDLKKFVETLMMLEEKGIDVTEENWQGIFGYILLRMSL